MNILVTLFIVWAAWNLTTFILMGIDKWRSKHDAWRISEATLLGTAFCMGALGSLLGSYIFHHKTQKKKFIIGLPLALIFNIVIIAGIFYLCIR